MSTNTAERQIHSAITELAADWYIAHRSGPLSESERGTFLTWLKSSPVHIEEYLGVAALDRILPEVTQHPRIPLAALAAMAREDSSVGVVELLPNSRVSTPATAQTRPTRGLFWQAVAAFGVLCAVAIGVLWVMHIAPSRDRAVIYQTARGEQGTWQLPDGSTLRLDSETAVTVHFSSAGRLVELNRGQLWVAVAHDVRRPFQVRAGAAQVLAVGTEFDVYRMRASTRVTVLQGQVAVSILNTGTQRTLRVGADQELQLIDGVLPDAAAPAHRRETMAWLERKIVFERRPLGEVAEEFNRYNPAPFTIDDPALRRLPISGAFDVADVESFAAFLQSLQGVRVEKLPDAFKITASRR
jgi:transmembrane sensor